MISLDRCRQLLGDPLLPDDQISSTRDALYSLGFKAYDDYTTGVQEANEERSQSADIPIERFQFDRALLLIPEDEREGIEERAAIKEFEGEIDRDEAERTAIQEYIDRQQL